MALRKSCYIPVSASELELSSSRGASALFSARFASRFVWPFLSLHEFSAASRLFPSVTAGMPIVSVSAPSSLCNDSMMLLYLALIHPLPYLLNSQEHQAVSVIPDGM